MNKGNGRNRKQDALEYTVVSPQDSQMVVVEKGGRISIPPSIYDRIGSGPGGHVKMRKVGTALVIERIDD